MLSSTPDELYERHRDLLRRAQDAVAAREFWTPYPEGPGDAAYGTDAAAAGERAFEQLIGRDFAIEVPGAAGRISPERSPYGLALDVSYPRSTVDALVAAARAAMPAWREVGPHGRAGVAAEILTRLNARSFEIAQAVRHTTGQPFMMAFQAGGPHAQDRGLEATAVALTESTRFPAVANWEKPHRGAPIRLHKTFTVVPRGVSLVIGCNTFPTWNSYPGLFASLVAGNPVIVKPHPRAILPLAITVQTAREVLAGAGLDPNLVTLAVEEPGDGIAATLATHPAVRVVDFTGSRAFGDWLEANARHAVVYTEKAGLNTVVLDSTDDYPGLLRNLATSLSLYSGQMCTTPQNLLVPLAGISTPAGARTPDEFAADLGAAIDRLLGDDRRAAAILGAIVNDEVLARVDEAGTHGRVVRAADPMVDPDNPKAILRTPLVLRLDADAESVYSREWFGPISFVVATASTTHSLELFRTSVTHHGAIAAAVYSTSEEILVAARQAALDCGVHLSENLTGGVLVNQNAAFSDLHGTAANPAATATLADAAFVTGRFSVLESRRHV
ncbi:phenylacetic acid degradation protein PaaN [Dactylosporangium sp. AC04546]|uniref:phenylacetic acid degradation protein PaaN n=1 Tax=Dactylosporangium sp. AC04546 TaxID=2862460 RepID=UPI001EE088B7|nr:phenylacetic acid degradation protein PaaN [Dactylosporangium sp. AC04546]WVK89010.1 phenylacetic acid degradation protein PaaN [Dactylosporangium sp. AC04546]